MLKAFERHTKKSAFVLWRICYFIFNAKSVIRMTGFCALTHSECVDDNILGLQLALQDTEKSQQLSSAQSLHIHLLILNRQTEKHLTFHLSEEEAKATWHDIEMTCI